MNMLIKNYPKSVDKSIAKKRAIELTKYLAVRCLRSKITGQECPLESQFWSNWKIGIKEWIFFFK